MAAGQRLFLISVFSKRKLESPAFKVVQGFNDWRGTIRAGNTGGSFPGIGYVGSQD
jgi:hypothetical protein